MRFEEEKMGQVTVVRVMVLRIDASSAGSFQQKMADLIGGGTRLLVLNLAQVTFIDSSGLASIISTLKAIGREGDLAIAAPQETVMSLFRLTRMNRVFHIFDTEAEAIRSLEQR